MESCGEKKCDDGVLLVSVFVWMMMMMMVVVVDGRREIEIGVGVILDMESSVGKMGQSCISMALQDFYEIHSNYTTFILPHFRHYSSQDHLQAASAGIDLIKNVQVMAIIGPQQSPEAKFVIDVGNKSKVPILSPATDPFLSANDNPYFIRVSHNSSSQAKPIAALIKSFNWRDVIFICDFDCGLFPYLSNAITTAQLKYHPLLSDSDDDYMLVELYKLKAMQTRVFVVHLLQTPLASRLFNKANEIGMMEEGYAWIITDVLTSLLHSLDHVDVLDSMQGVLGVKPYIPRSSKLNTFEKIWKNRFRGELDMFGIWFYDSTFALAMALERLGTEITTTFQPQNTTITNTNTNTTDLGAIATSNIGPRLLSEIQKTRLLDGLSSEFIIVDGQLQSQDYQIVNIIGKEAKTVGYWTLSNGISNKLTSGTRGYKNSLGAVIWPGDTHIVPKGWGISSASENRLRIGIPIKSGYSVFIQSRIDPETKEVKATGFSVDVFMAVREKLPYDLPYEFIPFQITSVGGPGDYNAFVYQIFLEKFDGVIGDVTILANRSKYVDFALPYSEGGASLVVPVKVDERKTAWIFMRPLEATLWITIFAFFVYTGTVIWVLEHRVNKEFRGSPYKQAGMIFWFSFSTLVFAHKEKMTSNLSKLVMIVWIFVVLVLTSSYTASLTSMLTVQQLQPVFTDINSLMKQGDYIGYMEGSYVGGMLIEMGFDSSKLRNYGSLDMYDEAMSRGSKNGGVSAIFDELPYIRVFLAKNCHKYIMVGPIYKTGGFAFAFQKGSRLVSEVSSAVLQVTEDKLTDITTRWFGRESDCPEERETVVTSARLSVASFKGLFLVAGLSSTFALLIYLFRFLYENRSILASREASMRQKLLALAKSFDDRKYEDEDSKNTNTPQLTTGR